MSLALIAIAGVIAIIASLMIFALRNILHSALALAGLFVVNSIIFLMLGQGLLAAVQLFIMVGGVATFLFVGVASSQYDNFKNSQLPQLVVLFALVAAAMAFPLANSQLAGLAYNELSPSGAGASFASDTAGLFYMMMILMFGVSLGAILLLKKVGK